MYEEIRAIDWAPNGKFIVAANIKGKISIIDIKTCSV